MYLFGSGKCTSEARVDGKTVVITGANTGIGIETARELLKRGARVVMACRNMTLAEEAMVKLKNEVEGAQIRVVHLDLASLASVKECAADLNKTEKKIHILINNAGVMACPYTVTKDGLEMQFQTNHLGHFLLTNLLLENIKASAPSRIINLSSRAHTNGRVNFDDLQSTKSYGALGAYSQSKLCNILFTLELTKRLKDTGVVTYSVHPGVVATELGRHFNSFVSGILSVVKVMFKNPLQGAQTTLHCVLDETLATQQQDIYYSDCRATTPSSSALDAEVATKLWQVSDELIANFEKQQLST